MSETATPRPVCRDCGADWKPVRRGECGRCGSDATPEPDPRVDQTIFVGDEKRKGNCVAACIATIVGVPLERVPHFVDFGIAYGDVDDDSPDAVSTGHHWWAMLLGYLAGHNRWVVELEDVDATERGEMLLVAGMSPRGVMHQVIYRDRRLWHDPHPSRAGVLEVSEVLAVRPLAAVGFDHAPTEGGTDV